ncbi:bifunctional metallophosphatase/5'-nucleotidase [Nocardioides ganghwensis]|uniref:bifunctional metallophosphatase/5'-nucleotidase n=1 Tax=Nocardioides ganghwensis TaxID=252230 RepID=UPI001A939BC3|nr:bifunctional UDP-sugar hydrolase/5'-nucleotidase [Nocardioides ganghwensis]
MPASRTGRRFALATSLTGLLAAPLAVVTAAAPAHAAPVEIQILGTNDFHGRLLPNGAEAGAAQFAGAVEQLRSENPNTIFTAAGDLIGASTFDSFIQKDKPTLDALNAAGLDVSAAGNHEFDQGYNDLVNRVMAPFDATANPYGGAEWQYIAANVRKKSNGSYALPDITSRTPDVNDESDGGTWTTTVGGVKVGFIGGVTEELSSLVSPAGIADVQVSSIINETNAAADALKADGADLVILLVHEGAPTTSLAAAQSNDNPFGRIVNGVDNDVSAIISGHTHLAYNHNINGRPVVSAGQYGTNLNKLVFTVDPVADTVALDSQSIVAASSLSLTAPSAVAKKAEVQEIVDDAVAKGNVLGAVELGSIAGPFDRAKLANGTTENRGGESTLGNLVAEVQRWATSTPEAGGAQIAFMNPGGLRDDMRGNPGGYPAKVTYKQAANVQSFANTLFNMKMTGAQIKTVLEQQWQTNPGGPTPSRPFLRLGVSKGFFVTYDTTRAEGDRVTGMWLNGKAIESATQYSVTANSFLAAGGDNFRGFTQATGKRDTGKVDLQAMVDYMAAFAKTPLPVNTNQQHVNVTWPAGAPRFYRLGQNVALSLSSLAMTGPSDPKDAALAVKVGNTVLASQPVDNTLGTAVFDDYGKSAVSFKLKGKTRTGKQMLTFTGPTTGTTFSLPIDVRKAKGELKARTKPGRIVKGETRTRVKIKASALGISPVTGKVIVKAGGKKYTVKLKKGKAFVRLAKFAKAGKKRIVVKYAGSRKVRSTKEVITIRVRRN